MNAVNPTINYHLVMAEQSHRRAHAERMRSVAGATKDVEAHEPALSFRQRLALAATTLLIAISLAAATAVATGGTAAGAASPVSPNDCAVVGPC